MFAIITDLFAGWMLSGLVLKWGEREDSSGWFEYNLYILNYLRLTHTTALLTLHIYSLWTDQTYLPPLGAVTSYSQECISTAVAYCFETTNLDIAGARGVAGGCVEIAAGGGGGGGQPVVPSLQNTPINIADLLLWAKPLVNKAAEYRYRMFGLGV